MIKVTGLFKQSNDSIQYYGNELYLYIIPTLRKPNLVDAELIIYTNSNRSTEGGRFIISNIISSDLASISSERNAYDNLIDNLETYIITYLQSFNESALFDKENLLNS
jgi:hypothetical protein